MNCFEKNKYLNKKNKLLQVKQNILTAKIILMEKDFFELGLLSNLGKIKRIKATQYFSEMIKNGTIQIQA